MAHFAQLDENNVVTRIIVVSNDVITQDGEEVESLGVTFCQKLIGDHTNWKQTSYNGSMRTRYAGVGYSYNETLDSFVPPQPFASWVLNNTSKDWDAPITQPTLTDEQSAAGSRYEWDEDAYQADNSTGWTLETPSS